MIAGLTMETVDRPDRFAESDAMYVMGRAFDPAFGEAWTAAQLAGIMGMGGTWLTVARVDRAALGFALIRSVLDECELLLLAVDPQWRGRGVGSSLLEQSFVQARSRGIRSMNLEVRASNSAVFLYEGKGFEYVHRRPAYYRGKDGQLYDALSFRKEMGY